MNIERNLIISILKLTKNGSISKEIVKKDARVTSEIAEKIFKKLRSSSLVYLQNNFLEADSLQRLKLAVYAVQLGADLETVSSNLQWKEFEDMAAFALERNGYGVVRNLRLKHIGHRWEIDVVGFRKPMVLCVDCKHWHRGMYPSALKRIVEEQVTRTLALAEVSQSLAGKVEWASWSKAKFFPVVLSLTAGRFKFYNDVPIVPILQLQDFLNQLPAYANSLKHFTRP